ncbi:MAG: DUF3047 domain-containing protein [Candidatus Methylomirabilis sp.]|nr:DUF3047 domain-containing protein [Deltaproteobacteria bacterium]
MRSRPSQRPFSFFLFAAVLLFSSSIAAYVHAEALKHAFLETFSDPDHATGLPGNWSPFEFPQKKGTLYKVVENTGNYVLMADSELGASALYVKFSADPREFPLISWRWKVDNVLSGDERVRDGDDYAARLCVIFEYEPEKASSYEKLKQALAKTVLSLEPAGNTIAYVWAGGLGKGEAIESPFTESMMMVAVESGPELAGRWVHEERNVLDDYRTLFGEEPPPIAGIAVMTDTDNTKSRAVAYYDDITLKHLNGGADVKP